MLHAIVYLTIYKRMFMLVVENQLGELRLYNAVFFCFFFWGRGRGAWREGVGGGVSLSTRMKEIGDTWRKKEKKKKRTLSDYKDLILQRATD